MFVPGALNDSPGDLRPYGTMVEDSVAAEAREAGPRLPPVEDIAVIAAGGIGGAIATVAYAYAQRVGVELTVRHLDSDWSQPFGVLTPEGDTIRLPAEWFIPVGAGHTRNDVKAVPSLQARYLDPKRGLFRGISVFETYPEAGGGSGGWPPIAAADLELSILDVHDRLYRLLLGLVGPGVADSGEDFIEAMDRAEGQAEGPPPRRRIFLPGGGCGAMGPVGHVLLPCLVRHIMTVELRQPNPYLVGMVAGPELFRGLLPGDRTLTNWLATVEQLRHQTEHGCHWEFPDGTVIDDDTPGYDRIVLIDGSPRSDGKPAAEADLARFAGEAGKLLYTLITSDVLERVESRTNNDRRTPWTVARGVLAQVDWAVVRPLATDLRAARRLKVLAAEA